MKIISRILLIIFTILIVSLLYGTITQNSGLIMSTFITIVMLSILCYIIKILKK